MKKLVKKQSSNTVAAYFGGKKKSSCSYTCYSSNPWDSTSKQVQKGLAKQY